MRKLIWVVSFLAIVGLLMPTASVLAQSSGGFGGRPANPDPNNPRSESIFIYTIESGETKEDQILVTNNSDKAATIAIYAVDGVTTNTGAYTCKQKSEAKVGIGEWLKLAEETVTLEPTEKKLVDFTLAMPENSDVGEHNGCLVFENAEDEGEIVNGGAVRLRTRSAIRVVATIPGELHRNIEIDSFTPTVARMGRQDYALVLQNNGNVSADVDVKVTLTNMFGEVIYENGGGYPVLSNQRLDLNYENEERPFWGGWFTAQTVIAYDKRAGTFGTENTAELITKESGKTTLFIMPSTIALVIIMTPIVLLLILITGFVLRRMARKRANKQWNTYIVQSGDTIESIAEAHGVAWKKLASINKIKAPYSVRKGQKLKAPMMAGAVRVAGSVSDENVIMQTKKTAKTSAKSTKSAKKPSSRVSSTKTKTKTTTKKQK